MTEGEPGRNQAATQALIDGLGDLTDEQAVHAAALLTIAIELDGDGTEKSPRPTPTLVREQRLTLEALAPKEAAADDGDSRGWLSSAVPSAVRNSA